MNNLQKYLQPVFQRLGTLQFPSSKGLGFQVQKLIITNLKIEKNFSPYSRLGFFHQNHPEVWRVFTSIFHHLSLMRIKGINSTNLSSYSISKICFSPREKRSCQFTGKWLGGHSMKCCYFRPFEEKKMHNVGEIEYYGLKSKFMTMKLKLKIINELSFLIGKASNTCVWYVGWWWYISSCY